MTIRGDYAHLPTERSVELPWLLNQPIAMPALDVGCNESVYLYHYADAMTPLDGIDVRPHKNRWLRTFHQGDIRTWEAPMKYATVIALSTIEHIGLAVENYGTNDDDVAFGDRKALEGCVRALRPGGKLLLTVPYSTSENRGWYRIYDKTTLARLLEGFTSKVEIVMNPQWKVGGVALCEVTA